MVKLLFKTVGGKAPEVAAAKDCPPIFSLRAHRLTICFLLLLANYFLQTNYVGMNTAILCMVNSTLTVDKFNRTTSEQKCAVKQDEMLKKQEFAIPGTMHWSASQQTLLLSASYYGSLTTAGFSGIIADRLGPDRVITAVLLFSTVVTLLTPTLSYADYNFVLASRVLAGAIEGFHQPSVSCLATRWYPYGEKSIAAAIYSTGSQFASGFSSLFASFLCRSSLLGGWPSVFYTFGTASFFFAFFWISLGTGGPAKNRWLSEAERKFLADAIQVKNKSAKRIPISQLLLSSPVHSVLICMFASSFTTSITHAFLPTYLRNLGLSIDMIGRYMLTPFLVQIPVKLVMGPAIGYCTRTNIISLNTATKASQSMGSFGAPIALLLLSTLPSCSNPSSAFYILIFYGVVYAGSTCGFYTSFLSISPENMGLLSTLMTVSSLAGSAASASIVSALTTSEITYKWTFMFVSAAILQPMFRRCDQLTGVCNTGIRLFISHTLPMFRRCDQLTGVCNTGIRLFISHTLSPVELTRECGK